MAKKEKTEDHTIRITNVDVRNVKRVQIASVPIANITTIVGGENAQGKSSFLDAIAMALGGKKLCPAKPLRDGERSGEVEVTVEGMHPRLPGKNKIIRRFTRRRDGGIKNEMEIVDVESGADANEPQTILNELISASMWDPSGFLGQSERKQFEHLRLMLGVDTESLDAERKKVYEERTGVGRKVKEAQVKVKDTYVNPDDIPEEQVITELIAERDVQVALQQDHQGNVSALAREKKTMGECQETLDQKVLEIQRLHEELQKAKDARDKLQETLELHDARVDELEKVVAETEIDAIDESVNEYVTKIEAAEQSNKERQRLLQKQQLHTEMQDQLRQSEQTFAELTESIDEIDQQKNRILAEIDWPVDGLEFDFGNQSVMFNGVPLSQASSAEQLRVAVGIELAEDRPLPVMIVKNGSLLDSTNLAMIARLVAEKGGQLFVERVGKGEECTIVFEDGVIENVEAKEG